MIVDGILKFFFEFILWVANLLPVLKINMSLIEGQAALFSVINNVSCIMPVGTFGVIISLILVIYTVESTWAIINWIIAKIPTIN